MLNQDVKEVIGTEVVRAYVPTGNAFVQGGGAQLYYLSDGSLNAFNGICDSASLPGHWGVAQAVIASLNSGLFVVKGKAVAAAGTFAAGSQDAAVTAVAASGGLTLAAWGSTNADLALGVTWASGLIIF